ncbi:TonB family protein [Psychrobacter sp. TAE2020]|uniref:energy transducer TonB n=1 Tax=Psychrobacter sp. TAE2020 TaxID=2846762 RepID=UPI001C110939|nr:energy transducer TonB [Psychrobacter sp. TAE2020]MBU5617788.1 TonB family protein [Psychrobacter sp. TAE2020]
MASTNPNTSSLKLIVTAIGIVVILHLLTAMALVMVNPTTPITPPPKALPPIEIQLLQPSIEIEPLKIDNIEITQPEPVLEVKAQPKVKPVTAKPQVVEKAIEKIKPASKKVIIPPVTEEKTKPNELKLPIAKTVKQQPIVAKPVNQQPLDIVTNSKISTASADAKRAQDIADAKAVADSKRAQDMADAKAVADSKRAQDMADAKAVADSKRAQDMADAKAVADSKRAQDIADAKAAADAAKAQAKIEAANNEPMSFTAGNASWAGSPPNFSFPSRAEKGARSGDSFTVGLLFRVNKQGGIESVKVANSSGNALLDRTAVQQAGKGKFKPFTKDGVPRVGNVTLSVTYKMP